MSGERNIRLDWNGGYSFTVDFGDAAIEPLRIDEPAPLGGGDGPNALGLLGAAVAQCLASSFLFCASKARVEVVDLRTSATVITGRNEAGRVRVSGIRALLEPTYAPGTGAQAARCLTLFEDYCTVTGSVRAGIDIDVDVAERALAPA